MTNTVTHTATTTSTDAASGPTRTIPEVPQDPRPLFGRATDIALAVVAGVRPDQLAQPTPCDDFDVRALITHLVEVVQRVAAVGEGGDPFALPGVADDAGLEVLRSAFADGVTAARQAFADDAHLDAMRSLPWATMPGRAHLATYTNELTVHTWDLAAATAQAVRWDAEVIALADRAIRAAFPPNRSVVFEALAADLPEHLRGAYPWRDATEPAAGAADIDRLVAYNGRDPQRWELSAG